MAMSEAVLTPAGSAVSGSDPMVPVPYRVMARREDGTDTVTLTLAPASAALPAARPGQFFMLWAPGVGEVPISLGGLGPEGTIEETIRVVGAVSRALAGAEVAATIGVRGPFGTAWDLDAAVGRHLLFVAGGVGLVPLQPSVVEAIARAGEFETIAVVVGARTPADLLFVDTLDAWASAGVQVITTVDRGDRAWHGHIGVVTEVLDLVECAPARTSALVCGPEVMMRFTAQALEGMGVPLSDVQLSLERNMKCAVGHCGHCQIGGSFVCLDGPVVTADRATPLLRVRER